MGNLREVAEWLSAPPSEDDLFRLRKVASSLDEVENIVNQVGHRLSIPIALGLSALAGIGAYKKTKAEFDPRVQALRNRYYGAN